MTPFDDEGKFLDYPEYVEHPEWFEEFREIAHESDKTGDYYDETMKVTAKRDKKARKKHVLSSAWSRGRKRKKEAAGVVFDLLNIKEVVHNLLKIHGIPRDTQVGLATLGNAAKGLSGFLDLENFTGPYILLDKSIYEECEADEILDVYCGVGLHEASHVNHSREIYKRMERGWAVGKRRMWENVLEDERIESLAVEESPGFEPYFIAAKRALFEKKEHGQAMAKWDSMSDLDKILLLIFGFLRVPHLLTDEHKAWKALNGECIYDTLRKLFPSVPKTEAEVAHYGGVLEDFWNRRK